MFVLSAMVGLVTPPVGIILAMTATVAGITLEAVARAVVGFVAWTIAVIVLIVLAPSLSLWLPRLLGF